MEKQEWGTELVLSSRGKEVTELPEDTEALYLDHNESEHYTAEVVTVLIKGLKSLRRDNAEYWKVKE